MKSIIHIEEVSEKKDSIEKNFYNINNSLYFKLNIIKYQKLKILNINKDKLLQMFIFYNLNKKD